MGTQQEKSIFQNIKEAQKYKHLASFPADRRSKNIVCLQEEKYPVSLVNREMQMKIKTQCRFVHTLLSGGFVVGGLFFVLLSKGEIIKAEHCEVVRHC